MFVIVVTVISYSLDDDCYVFICIVPTSPFPLLIYLVYRYMYCLYYHILYTQPKCFGNTVERYGHANKAFEF